jgi:hypothetical protein
LYLARLLWLLLSALWPLRLLLARLWLLLSPLWPLRLLLARLLWLLLSPLWPLRLLLARLLWLLLSPLWPLRLLLSRLRLVPVRLGFLFLLVLLFPLLVRLCLGKSCGSEKCEQ